MASGKFHGVIIRRRADGLLHRQQPGGAVGRGRPAARDAHGLLGEPAEELGAVGDLASLSASVLPISRVISMANSSARAVISSNAARRISPRSRGGVAAQSACAATAASSAARPSSTVASAHVGEDLARWRGRRPSRCSPPLPSRHCAADEQAGWARRRCTDFWVMAVDPLRVPSDVAAAVSCCSTSSSGTHRAGRQRSSRPHGEP